MLLAPLGQYSSQVCVACYLQPAAAQQPCHGSALWRQPLPSSASSHKLCQNRFWPSAWTLLRAMQSAWGRAAACARDVARSLWEVVRIRTFIVIVLQARRSFLLC